MGDVNFGPFGVSGVEAAEDGRCSSREDFEVEWLDCGLDVESGASSNVSCPSQPLQCSFSIASHSRLLGQNYQHSNP